MWSPPILSACALCLGIMPMLLSMVSVKVAQGGRLSLHGMQVTVNSEACSSLSMNSRAPQVRWRIPPGRPRRKTSSRTPGLTPMAIRRLRSTGCLGSCSTRTEHPSLTELRTTGSKSQSITLEPVWILAPQCSSSPARGCGDRCFGGCDAAAPRRSAVPGSACPAAPLFQLDDEEASIVHSTLKK